MDDPNKVCDQRIQDAIDALVAIHRAELERINHNHAEDWRHAAERQDAQLRQMAELQAKNQQLEDEIGHKRHEIGNLKMIKKFMEETIAELEDALTSRQHSSGDSVSEPAGQVGTPTGALVQIRGAAPNDGDHG